MPPVMCRDFACTQESCVRSERVQKRNWFGEISSNGAYTLGTSKVEVSKHTG